MNSFKSPRLLPILRHTILALLTGILISCQPALRLQTDVLVVGGGASGTAAGLQAARLGVRTLIAEPGPWLGGMITAAGVSAFDGNHNMPSGIWAEFREQLYKVYGGPARVATGWVSNTQFEPHVGDSIFKSMAAREPNLRVEFGLNFEKAIVEKGRVSGASFTRADGRRVMIRARQVIDASELGDVMASAGTPFDVGMEASRLTGENVNVPESNDIIQDLTWVAILKDYGPAADCTLVKPAGYDPMEFDGCNNQFSSTPEKLTSNVDAKKMLDYGKLPHGKYMINWPGKGNDIYLNVINLSPAERARELQKARDKTLRFVYFLQTQFGFKNIGLADDEFPTPDRLALMPYHREGRRLQGLVRMKIQHIARPFEQPEALYRTGISVGDYPIDHHHRENLSAPQHLGFYPVPSYNIPLGALIPATTNGLVVAEKGISVSNVVNGTTRLQPVVMCTGQAAGTLAALAAQQNKEVRDMSVREVQATLLKTGAYIMPYFDVKPTHPHFSAIQRIGATGILKGTGEPIQWANRTWFYPDSLVSTTMLLKDLEPYLRFSGSLSPRLTVAEAQQLIAAWWNAYGVPVPPGSPDTYIRNNWERWGLSRYDPARSLTRAEWAVLLDRTVDPFGSVGINHQGNIHSTNKN